MGTILIAAAVACLQYDTTYEVNCSMKGEAFICGENACKNDEEFTNNIKKSFDQISDVYKHTLAKEHCTITKKMVCAIKVPTQDL